MHERGLGDRVEPPRRLDHTAVPELLARADISCLVSSHEGMPGAVMEAMAAGLPVEELTLDRMVAATGELYRTLVRPGAS